MNGRGFLVVWDWNGTLLDDFEAILTGVNTILRHYGRAPVDVVAYREAFDIPIDLLYTNLGFSVEEVRQHLSDYQAIFHRVYEPQADKTSLRAGADDALKETVVRGGTNIILSNHIREPIARQVRRLGLESQIEALLASEARTPQKGDPAKGDRLVAFMHANGWAAESTVIIGDTPEEVRIARALGLRSVALTGGAASESRLRAAGPDVVLDSLEDLPRWWDKEGRMAR